MAPDFRSIHTPNPPPHPTACLHLHGARPYFLIRPRKLGIKGGKLPFDQEQDERALLRIWSDPAAIGERMLGFYARLAAEGGYGYVRYVWTEFSPIRLSPSFTHTRTSRAAAELVAFENELEEAMCFQLYQRVRGDGGLALSIRVCSRDRSIFRHSFPCAIY